MSVEISTEIIPEGGSATLTVSYTGNLHQSYTVNAVITITPDTASGATGKIELSGYSESFLWPTVFCTVYQ